MFRGEFSNIHVVKIFNEVHEVNKEKEINYKQQRIEVG